MPTQHVPRRLLHPLPAVFFQPNDGEHEFPYTPSENDYNMMGIALDKAREAGLEGDSPIGAVLVHTDGDLFAEGTTEFRENKVWGHAEMNVIEAAREKVGRYLGECVLYTTAEPCPGCSYFLNKAQIGLVLIGATREDAPEFFRKRKTRLNDILADSRRSLTIVKGLRKIEAAELLTADAKKH